MQEIFNKYDISVKFQDGSVDSTYVIETRDGKVRLSGLDAQRIAVEILDNDMRVESSTGKQKFGGREIDKLENIVQYLIKE
jgi:hypothetical protein